MSLYSLVLYQTLRGQQMINRFNYQLTGTPAVVSGSFGLAAAMGFVDGFVTPSTSYYDTHKASVGDEVTFTEVEVINLYDPVDFYVQPLLSNNTGAQSGETLPPFNAFGFRTNRVRRDIRRGFKRFGGVLEAQSGSGGQLPANIITGLQAWADVMSATLPYDDEGNTLNYSPVVLGLNKIVNPDGSVTYRRYDTEAEQLLHLAGGISYTPYTTIRSQTSRQYGRGS